jgi:phage antirepressor YoqD-like protein
MELGLFEVTLTTITTPKGKTKTIPTTRVTTKGLSYFINKFINEAINSNEQLRINLD